MTSVLVGTAACVQPTNPFDPQTPPNAQAPVTIEGRIQGIVEPVTIAGEPILLEAASCPTFDGNHSGFEVILRGIGLDGETEGVRAASQQTEDNGLYRFENAPPGDYTIEFARAGFTVPPPISIGIAAGETVAVPTRCAVKTEAPERPALSDLPARTNAASVTLVVDGCDQPGVTTTITQTGVGDVAPQTLPDESGQCAATFPLVGVDGAIATVRTVRFSAVSEDALGNRSAVTERTVTYDALAPVTPEAVTLVPSSTRVEASWVFPAADVDDDGTAVSVLSYSILPREEDAGADCPFGQPTEDDPFDVAAFAAEGRSPLRTTETRQSLTEIPTGTTVYVQVAGIDSLGNRGCYSAPVAARVDAVTVLREEPTDAAPSLGRATIAGTTAEALGNGGLRLTFQDGTTQTINVPAFDVVAATRQFFAPAREAGLLEVEINHEGEVVAETIHSVGTIRSVAKRAGVLILGTDTGLAVAADGDPAGTVTAVVDPANLSAPVERIFNFGRGLVLVRSSSPARVQLVRRDDPTVVLGSLVLGDVPRDALLAGDALFLALRTGDVQRTSLGGCRDRLESGAPGAVGFGCFVPEIPVPLPASATAEKLALVDDLLAVAAEASGETEATGLYLLDVTGTLAWVGQAALPPNAQVRGIQKDPLQVCVLTREDNTDRRHCFSMFFLARIAREVNLAAGVRVDDIQAANGEAFITEASAGDLLSFDVGLLRGALGSIEATRYVFSFLDAAVPGLTLPTQFPLGAPRTLTVANTGPYAIALDQYGRLHLAQSSDVGLAQLTLLDSALPDALLANAPDLVETSLAGDHLSITSAFVVRDGEALVFALSNAEATSDTPCAAITLARVVLAEDPITGDVSTVSAEVLTLGQARAVGQLVLHGSEARVSTAPFGLLRASLGPTLSTTAGVVPECSEGLAEQTAAFDILKADAETTWVTARRADTGVLQAGVYAIDADQTLTRLQIQSPGNPQVGTTAGDTLMVATETDGAFVFDTSGPQPWFPILALPSVRDPRNIRATDRGFAVANGAFGATWFVLQ